MTFHDFDPTSLCTPVVRHETRRMFIAKYATQNLIVEGADMSNAYV